MDLTDFKLLSFDCYGTLVDWETGLKTVLEPWAARAGAEATTDQLLAAFAKHENRVQRANRMMLYPDVLRWVLRAIADDFGVTCTTEDENALAGSIGDWPVFPDTTSALRYLKQHYKLVILSNVDISSFAKTERKISVEFDAILTAEEIRSYKPDPRNFEFLMMRCAVLDVDQSQILHTAQSLFHDIRPASYMGLATAWINRRADQGDVGATPAVDDAPEIAAAPDFTFNSLEELAEAHRQAVSG